MIPKNVYRLNEYRISEFADGHLWWDTYSGFGTEAGGQCFIYGNTLLMGTQHHGQDGFLILEYFDNLKKLPLWNKTLYYCFTSALLDVVTGRNIGEDRLPQLFSLPCKARGGVQTVIADKHETFRLRQYQISITPRGDISWKSYGGMDRIVGGSVVIESDILFIGPGKYDDSQQKKREFLGALQLFPKWEQTTFWCRSLAIKPVLIEKKQTPRVPFQKKEKGFQGVITPANNRKSEYARKIWSEMVGYCGERFEEVKTGCQKVWPKREKPIEIENKSD